MAKNSCASAGTNKSVWPMARRHLIHSTPNYVSIAQSNLKRQGYRDCYAGVLDPVQLRCRWLDSIASLFLEYLFLQLELSHASESIWSTVGVVGIDRFGRVFAIVQEVSECVCTDELASSAVRGMHSDLRLLECAATNKRIGTQGISPC